MSHIVRVECSVTDLGLLKSAASRLGLVVEENGVPRYFGSAHGGRESQACELVILLPGKYDLGVKRRPDGAYEWICDGELLAGSYGRDDAGRALLGEGAEHLMTAYAQAAVERDLLPGATYSTSIGEDGTIFYDVDESELLRLGYHEGATG